MSLFLRWFIRLYKLRHKENKFAYLKAKITLAREGRK